MPKSSNHLSAWFKLNHLNIFLDDIKKQVEHLKKLSKMEITQMDVDRAVGNDCDMTCDMCDSEFESLPEAQYHYLHEHNISDGYIKCCSIKYKTIEKLKKHLFWHLHPEELK